MSVCGECGKPNREINSDTDNCFSCDAKIAETLRRANKDAILEDTEHRAWRGGWNPHFLKALQAVEQDQ